MVERAEPCLPDVRVCNQNYFAFSLLTPGNFETDLLRDISSHQVSEPERPEFYRRHTGRLAWSKTVWRHFHPRKGSHEYRWNDIPFEARAAAIPWPHQWFQRYKTGRLQCFSSTRLVFYLSHPLRYNLYSIRHDPCFTLIPVHNFCVQVSLFLLSLLR